MLKYFIGKSNAEILLYQIVFSDVLFTIKSQCDI